MRGRRDDEIFAGWQIEKPELPEVIRRGARAVVGRQRDVAAEVIPA